MPSMSEPGDIFIVPKGICIVQEVDIPTMLGHILIVSGQIAIVPKDVCTVLGNMLIVSGS